MSAQNPQPTTALAPYAPQSAALAETASTSAAAMATAAVQARYVMAHQRPRNWDEVRVRFLAECKRPGFAAVADYARPVGRELVDGVWVDKIARGPSIRCIEAALRIMGNVDVQTPAIFDDATKRIVRATVVDLETNANYSKDIFVSKTVERLSLKKGEVPVGTRTNSKGATLYILAATDDQVATKEAAMLSKAIRELGKRLVPGDLIDEGRAIAAKIRATVDAEDPDGARKKVIDAFADQRVPPAELTEFIGHDLAQLTTRELEYLRGLYQSLRDGEAVWHELLEERRHERTSAKG